MYSVAPAPAKFWVSDAIPIFLVFFFLGISGNRIMNCYVLGDFFCCVLKLTFIGASNVEKFIEAWRQKIGLI